MLEWPQRFAETNKRMLLYSQQIVENGTYAKQQLVSAYGPLEFQQEMAELASRGETWGQTPKQPLAVCPLITRSPGRKRYSNVARETSARPSRSSICRRNVDAGPTRRLPMTVCSRK